MVVLEPFLWAEVPLVGVPTSSPCAGLGLVGELVLSLRAGACVPGSILGMPPVLTGPDPGTEPDFPAGVTLGVSSNLVDTNEPCRVLCVGGTSHPDLPACVSAPWGRKPSCICVLASLF